jgi:hypothetical protein
MLNDFMTDLRALMSQHENAGTKLPAILTALKRAVVEVRQELLPSKADDEYNAKRGVPPMTEAQRREIAQLEPYEPMPPQRAD